MKLPRIFRSEEFVAFSKELFRIASSIRAVLLALTLLLVAGGMLLQRVESLGFWGGQYLAFVTALTIGYGDVTPESPVGKVTCIALGIIGMIVMGLVVGAASVALRHAAGKE